MRPEKDDEEVMLVGVALGVVAVVEDGVVGSPVEGVLAAPGEADATAPPGVPKDVFGDGKNDLCLIPKEC